VKKEEKKDILDIVDGDGFVCFRRLLLIMNADREGENRDIPEWNDLRAFPHEQIISRLLDIRKRPLGQITLDRNDFLMIPPTTYAILLGRKTKPTQASRLMGNSTPPNSSIAGFPSGASSTHPPFRYKFHTYNHVQFLHPNALQIQVPPPLTPLSSSASPRTTPVSRSPLAPFSSSSPSFPAPPPPL
jgi:hypothetical protein